MLLAEAKKYFAKQGMATIQECSKFAHTLSFKRKCEAAKHRIEAFLSKVKNPILSCGGGKDSTAMAVLCRQVAPDIPIVCADPPNPLSDRKTHVEDLFSWLGGSIYRVSYDWNVQAVLEHEAQYPEGLKQRILSAWHKDKGIDGVVFGIRTAESRVRRLLIRSRGFVYQNKGGGWRCCPIADMTAQEALCVALLYDAPINPVYTKQKGACNLERIRDGTWWPHGMDDSLWIKEYYPEHYEDYLRALSVYDVKKSIVCSY